MVARAAAWLSFPPETPMATGGPEAISPAISAVTAPGARPNPGKYPSAPPMPWIGLPHPCIGYIRYLRRQDRMQAESGTAVVQCKAHVQHSGNRIELPIERSQLNQPVLGSISPGVARPTFAIQKHRNACPTRKSLSQLTILG